MLGNSRGCGVDRARRGHSWRAALVRLIRSGDSAARQARRCAAAEPERGPAEHEAAFTSGWQNFSLVRLGRKSTNHSKRDPLEGGSQRSPKPDLSSDEALLAALDYRNLAARKAEKDAVAGRIADALKLATQLLEPKVQFVSLEKTTLHSPDEVRQW